MATRSAVPFEVHAIPLSMLRPLPLSQRTLRPVVRDRQPLPRGRRPFCSVLPFILLARASTDSTDQDVSAEPKLVQDAEKTEARKSAKTKSTELPELPKKKTLEELSVGDVLDAVVKTVVVYGCFLDAECVVDIFVHVSDFADYFVGDAEKVLKRGDKVKVEVTQIDDRLRGSLKNHNQFQERTRTSSDKDQSKTRGPKKNMRAYTVFETFDGTVERITKNGAIVRFDEGRATGYLPREEIVKEGMKEDSETPVPDLLQGDEQVEVRVLRVEDGSRRLTLTMREIEEIEMEQKAETDGFFIADGEESEVAILNAAFRRAGIVREMFANGWDEEAITAKPEPVGQTPVKKEVPPLIPAEQSRPDQPSEEPAVVQELKTGEALEKEEPAAVTSEIQTVPDVVPSVEKEEPATVTSEIQAVPDVAPPVEERESTAVTSERATEVPTVPAVEPVVEEEDSAPVTSEIPSLPDAEPPVEEEEPKVVTPESIVEPVPEASDVKRPPVPEVEPTPEVPPPEKTPVMAADSSSPAPKTVPEETSKPAEGSSARIAASIVKQLREISGAGMMDCKKALTECNGDMDAALEFLKKKGIASAAKRAGKVASDGLIGSYIHMGAKLGVLLEVNSETDFVARTDTFKQFVDDIAMTIAASPDAICVSPDDFPPEVLDKKKELEMAKEDVVNKPAPIREKIVLGRLEKLKKQGAVLEQPFIQDQEKTVQTALTELTASLGEKISIRRFVRFELGEGLEKKSADFAAEVADQIETKKAEAAVKEPAVSSDVTPATDKPAVKVPASAVKELRQMTGGGLMDCKKALAECNCDLEKAAEYLQKKGLAGAAKKAGRLASEGAICSYIHLGSKLGVLAEVNCETDFVARGDDFKQLADDVAMQLAACPEVDFISEEDIPKEVMEKELEAEMAKEDLRTKPEAIRQKIAEGRVGKTIKTRCLYDQPFLKDTEKTVGDVVKEYIVKLGENIKVRRFVRYNLGEGIEKKESNFAAEVAEQVQQQQQQSS